MMMKIGMMKSMTREQAIDIIKNLPIYRAEMEYDKHSDLMQALEMAIESIENTGCSVCTRRNFYQQGYRDGLNADKWIPCSERLPQEDGEYLVWYCGDDEDEDAEKGFMLVPFWTDVEMFGVYHDIFDSHTLGFVDSEFYECETVIAWMPLPSAYKGE